MIELIMFNYIKYTRIDIKIVDRILISTGVLDF